ncbi:MAG: serine/threonine protein kinase [Myxococcota bacterium]|nr:serine/threonine protein kinase [Myxococcota bacterium]
MSEEPEAFGPYLIHEELGVGGMAQVHRAEVIGIEGFKRSVALKRMLEHVAMNDDLVAAFVREARLASHMRHRNIPQTYELGKVGEIYFIAMELITGFTLREVLKHCGQTTGPMPVSVALNILNQICDALDYAHNLADDSGQQLGIIHRDVSPSNIIVAEGGCVKLIDFGIAKASAVGMQTMSGTIKGKFGYMAPEYIGGSIDARADLFAVGVIAHELLTNRPLFSGPDDMDTLNRVMKMELLPPSHSNPNVPPEIDEIVMTALERDPEKRWQHATALRSALTTLTKRLGLVVQDRHVIEWVTWALEQTKPRQPSLRTLRVPTPHSSLSMSDIMTPQTEIVAAESMTTILDGRPLEPELLTPPTGTPSHMVAQPRLDTASETMQVDEHVPTLVRAPSVPRIEEVPRPPPQRLAPPAPAPVAKQTSPVVAVLLVLLAAAIAGTVVYLAL